MPEQQLILGAEKRNPKICVFECPETATLHVYHGFELMEVVPDQKFPRYRGGGDPRMACSSLPWEFDLADLNADGLAMSDGSRKENPRPCAGKKEFTAFILQDPSRRTQRAMPHLI